MIREKRIFFYIGKLEESGNINFRIQWFGRSLGLFGLRDKDSSCFRIFVELIKIAQQHELISSQELAYRLGLTRGTVVHHLNKLMDAGMVKASNNRYSLKEDSLTQVVESIQAEIHGLMKNLKKVAHELDEKIGLD